MRHAAQQGWDNKEQGIVFTSLYQYLPKQVSRYYYDEHLDKTHTPFRLPQWKELSSKAKVCFYQLAMAEIEKDHLLLESTFTDSEKGLRLVPFVFNESQALSSHVEASKQNEVEFLRRRLKKALEKALARPVDFWFALEMAPKGDSGQPHIQGSLLIKPSEAKKAREAFYKINDPMIDIEKQGALRFRSGKRRQLFKKRGQLYTDINWGLYCMKEEARVKSWFTGGNNTVTVTTNIVRRAKEYYDRLYKFDRAEKQKLNNTHLKRASL